MGLGCRAMVGMGMGYLGGKEGRGRRDGDVCVVRNFYGGRSKDWRGF